MDTTSDAIKESWLDGLAPAARRWIDGAAHAAYKAMRGGIVMRHNGARGRKNLPHAARKTREGKIGLVTWSFHRSPAGQVHMTFPQSSILSHLDQNL
ncbi:MAG: hypothetical protein JO269_07315 [Burkholderiaceae bacterium]|nr:hypothetical protein [Burkholderiaceae bacterium]